MVEAEGAPGQSRFPRDGIVSPMVQMTPPPASPASAQSASSPHLGRQHKG
jgi:hypothetical protein